MTNAFLQEAWQGYEYQYEYLSSSSRNTNDIKIKHEQNHVGEYVQHIQYLNDYTMLEKKYIMKYKTSVSGLYRFRNSGSDEVTTGCHSD